MPGSRGIEPGEAGRTQGGASTERYSRYVSAVNLLLTCGDHNHINRNKRGLKIMLRTLLEFVVIVSFVSSIGLLLVVI